MDPDLPDELLPVAWPRATARELFIICYDLLGRSPSAGCGRSSPGTARN
jgi:DNA-binding transcriptional regulator PaaX